MIAEKAGAILSFIILSLMFTTNASAKTLQVPGDHLTIQKAISASSPGDNIIVASGMYKLYYGNITIAKKAITLKSAHGPQKTTIEGRGGSPVISFVKDSRSAIDGFTITSTSDNDTDTSTLNGGGIYCSPSSSPTIVNNIITGNKAVFGGGIYCSPSSSPAIIDNEISKNNAVRSGGGIFSYKAYPTIVNNRIVENEASNAGGGIFCWKGSPRITNNVIWKNKARSGGGLSCDRSSCTIINDTIAGNVAVYGGGIFSKGGSVRIINTILWDNGDDLNSGWFSPASRPDHSDIGDGDFAGVNGNISGAPLFMDPENGDFRLKPDSPCIDSGNPNPIYYDPDGSRNDMGAYGGGKGKWRLQ
jgi:parallel beta-helix repeat protein